MYIDNKFSAFFLGKCHKPLLKLALMAVLFSTTGCSANNTNEYVIDSSINLSEIDTSDNNTHNSPTVSSYNENSNIIETQTAFENIADFEDSNSEKSDKPSSQTELNLQKRNYLNETYGVNIVYNYEADCYYGGSCTGITDDTLIAERLDLLEECLSIYPIELFKDLNEQSSITINLVDSLNGADGFTNGKDATAIFMALNCDNPATYFKMAFHHELFHFIEYYMRYRFPGEELLIYDTQNYNDTALYGTTDYTGTVYDNAANIYNQYFISVYAKKDAMEDRAETFTYYVFISQKESMKVADSPISMKMKIISEAIRKYCPSLSVYPIGTLPWETKITY